MVIAGAKPKPEGQKVNRVQPTHEWTEVLRVAYDGERPNPGRLPKVTQDWWDDISRMPHCILWEAAEWRFAIDTARVHAMAFKPKGRTSLIPEVRARERKMGVTGDDLRDLRIRYVEPAEARIETELGDMADFEAERRRRLLEAQ